jgi:hypothetical protein
LSDDEEAAAGAAAAGAGAVAAGVLLEEVESVLGVAVLFVVLPLLSPEDFGLALP